MKGRRERERVGAISTHGQNIFSSSTCHMKGREGEGFPHMVRTYSEQPPHPALPLKLTKLRDAKAFYFKFNPQR